MTVPELLLQKAQQAPHEVAYRAKKRGIYHERTWKELFELVAICATGLKKLGLEKGRSLALMGDPCEEYVIAEYAAQALGAITYGIYPTSSQKELKYLVGDGEAFIFVAENHEYVDRVLPLLGTLEHLKHVVVIDIKGMFGYDHPSLLAFNKLLETGEPDFRASPQDIELSIRRITPSDPLSIMYTSGTVSEPKGALISHGKHLAAACTVLDRYPILSQMNHRTVIYLPLCHMVGKEMAMTLPLLARIVPHFGEHIEDLEQTIFETAPTMLFTVPRYLQKFASKVLVGIQHSSPLKRFVYHAAMRVGRRHIRSLWEGKKNGLFRLAYLLSYQAVFRPILNKIGFDKLRLLVSVGAPLSAELAALWQIYGVNLSDAYGQTETGGAFISAQPGYFPRPGDVGNPPAGWEVTLADDGEILVRGQDIFEGYWKNPELTGKVIDRNKWLHTGDTGEWTAEGRLKIKDRLRDIIVTSGGKTISPTYIESALKASPYLSEVVVFGHNRKYLTALVELDFETVSAWARLKGITYTGFIDLCERDAVKDLIGGEIEKANADLARVEQVKTYRIIPKELDPWHDGEPITPTRKVKRDLMYQKFRDLVESMYTERGEAALVASEVGDMLT
jgi:long-chain acyl-CoA synthetase